MVAPAAQISAALAEGRRYGLSESGCGWSEARRVLVLVHGRDREPSELAALVFPFGAKNKVKLLAPWVDSRSWYDGRYDAALEANAAERDAGLNRIAEAIEYARSRSEASILLAGFSQGGCMVAEYLLARGRDGLGGAAIFTGSALSPRKPREEAAPRLDGLPILISGGRRDPFLPEADLARTAEILGALGASISLELFEDEDHVVRPAEIERLVALVSDGSVPHIDRSTQAVDHTPAL